ncbi:TRAP transporter large permease subunit [Roseomonas sp. NAR14]|uniref:TRAP transporter large permease protein n=1 Tax=Roseomonas acroporae TaxID=2937791 RepID=A0A9X2BVF0_9PROT|nr:TRAP transporter large permease subunit [Roseomonas acroporae]MCK8784961.1 TRAP transporter large permease subunit [Roseomonas acroporae]
MSAVLVLSFSLLMLAAIPVAHTLVMASGLAVLWDGQLPLMLIAQQMFAQTQSFPLLALPFFMLAGSLMMGGRLGEELLRFASEGMRRWRGGPLSTTVVASVVFGGVSGSAVANASALGSVLIPWQKRQGYPAGLCAANNATSAVIDILIPPSIPMILYALVSNVSIGELFLAGILPGLLMAGGFIGLCAWTAHRRGIRPDTAPVRKRELLRLAFFASPALLMPVLILLGLRFGLATPTEISVIAVVYALAASILIYRDMSWLRFRAAMLEAGVATGIVMLVIMGSAAAGWILTFDQVPQRFAEWVTATLHSPWLVILAMNVIMLLVGGPLDLPPGILLLGPIFVPLAAQIGLDPLQLGLMMVLNLGIGLYTPPVGTTLFISSSIARSSMSDTVRELWPFFGVALAVLAAISYIPALTLRF